MQNFEEEGRSLHGETKHLIGGLDDPLKTMILQLFQFHIICIHLHLYSFIFI